MKSRSELGYGVSLIKVHILMRVSINGGTPISGWFTRENPNYKWFSLGLGNPQGPQTPKFWGDGRTPAVSVGGPSGPTAKWWSQPHSWGADRPQGPRVGENDGNLPRLSQFPGSLDFKTL